MKETASSEPVPARTGAHGAGSLLPLVYTELRAAAGKLMNNQRHDHTLQPTALVHEAYAKLAKAGVRFNDDSHFYYAAAKAMRQILVDHALSRRRKKRGGAARIQLELNDEIVGSHESNFDWLAMDEALSKLAETSPRRAQVVMLRFFAGLTDAKISAILQISEPTVRRDWASARLWLFRHMHA
jgi:RNA polymerase sigma factor (TIGR02999 family)